MAEQYKRGQYNTVAQFIIKSLQSLGGSASREAIKKEIASDNANPFSDAITKNTFALLKESFVKVCNDLFPCKKASF